MSSRVSLAKNKRATDNQPYSPSHQLLHYEDDANTQGPPVAVFFAVALGLTFLDATDSTTVKLAWAYVGARVAHSLLQATSNVIPLRFGLFALSSTFLAGLAVKGLMLATV